MSEHHADRNLLFGILALQMDFIRRDDLIAAMNAWVLDKGRPLGQVLVGQGLLRADNHALLEALVQRHLEMHGNDPQQSLAAVSSLASARQDLEQLTDADVQASLAHVPATRAPGEDSPPTRLPSQGTATDGDPHGTIAPSLGSSSGSGPRFRILRPHARGGLGEVFVAETLGEDVLAALQAAWEAKDTPGTRARRMRAGLALLSAEPDRVKGPLFDWMLQVEDPAEMLLLLVATEDGLPNSKPL
jgi:hypothetical protein